MVPQTLRYALLAGRLHDDPCDPCPLVLMLLCSAPHPTDSALVCLGYHSVGASRCYGRMGIVFELMELTACNIQ